MTNDDSDRLLIGYFPLWGASYNSSNPEEPRFIAETISARKLDALEWTMEQKSDILDEYWHEETPVFVIVAESVPKGLKEDAILDSLSNTILSQGTDAVLALRLHRTGWFLDPALSEIVLNLGSLYVRYPGPYRQAMTFEVPHDDYLPSYELLESDLVSEGAEITGLMQVWRLVRQYRQAASNSSADIAIVNFHRSYGGYTLRAADRCAFLFTAIDAMFGGMNAYGIGGARLRLPFRDRLATALALSHTTPSGSSSAGDEAAWLDTEGRRIRNALAHGQSTEIHQSAESAYLHLQSLVRSLLMQYLRFSVGWATHADGLSLLGLTKEDGISSAYNAALESYAAQNSTALNLFLSESDESRQTEVESADRANMVGRHRRLHFSISSLFRSLKGRR